jgi:hypothetical protein
MYTAVFQAVAVTAAQDLFTIITSSTAAVVVHAIYIGQSSDFGDAQDELLRIALKRGMTSNGSGGGTYTPVPLVPTDAAFGGTCRINDTTASSGGTIVVLDEQCFNVRSGYVFVPTPEMRSVVQASTGGRFAVNLVAAPADSLTVSGTIYFEELS